jgi:hypothetical protein
MELDCEKKRAMWSWRSPISTTPCAEEPVSSVTSATNFSIASLVSPLFQYLSMCRCPLIAVVVVVVDEEVRRPGSRGLTGSNLSSSCRIRLSLLSFHQYGRRCELEAQHSDRRRELRW